MHRDATFDLSKGLAMFMVIYSHVIFYRPGFELKTMPSLAINFIMVVAMPLFFMLSGYFSSKLHKSRNWSDLFRRFTVYFWPMAFFSFVFNCIDCLILGRYPVAQFPLNVIKTFLFAGWFFYALAFCDFIVFCTFRFDELWKKFSFFIFALCVCFIGSGRLWHVDNVIQMMPFYVFGLVLVPVIIRNYRLWLATAFLGLSALICVTYFCGNIATNGMSFYWDKIDVFCLDVHKIINYFLRIVVGTLGCLFILLVLRKLTQFHGLKKNCLRGYRDLGYVFPSGMVDQNLCSSMDWP